MKMNKLDNIISIWQILLTVADRLKNATLKVYIDYFIY